MKKLTTLMCSAALLASGTAIAEQQPLNFELSLSGTVKTDSYFDENDGGMNAQLGFYLTKAFQVNIRQYGFINSKDTGGNTLEGASGIFGDYHLDLGSFQPYVGLGGLYNYGSGERENDFDVGAEFGMKYFVLPKTFVVAQGTYMRSLDDIGNGDKSYTLFSLGLGFDF